MVKRLYADGGTEFINQTLKAFCAKHGKELRWTPARIQQLNGAAERSVRTFKDYERTMIAARGRAAEAVGLGRQAMRRSCGTARTSRKDTGMTPYEAMRGKKPSLRHLSVWGCDAYCHVPKEQRSALEPKAEPCIYLGHNEAQNAAYVLLLSTRKVIISRDVTYRSDSFTFMHALARGDDGVRDALAQCRRCELRSEDDSEPDRVPAQGGQEDQPAAASSDSECDGTSDSEEEYVVESIVGQRRRNGRTEYKVHWAGYGADEDTWEPEPSCQRRWRPGRLAGRAATAPARRSERHGSRERSMPLRASASEEPIRQDEPQVHMAMSALRSCSCRKSSQSPSAADERCGHGHRRPGAADAADVPRGHGQSRRSEVEGGAG